MTPRDEFKAMAFGPGKQLAAQDPDAYLEHIDATNRPEPPCGFCKGQPVGNAATWLDGKPRPPAMCPRCGETNYPNDERQAHEGTGGDQDVLRDVGGGGGTRDARVDARGPAGAGRAGVRGVGDGVRAGGGEGRVDVSSSSAAQGSPARPLHSKHADNLGVSGSLVRGGDPDPSLSENPNHARDERAVLAALRNGPRARSGLAKAIKDAGNTMCKPGGDDRDVVFTLDRLARLGYDIRSTTDRFGRARMYLAGDPDPSLNDPSLKDAA